MASLSCISVLEAGSFTTDSGHVLVPTGETPFIIWQLLEPALFTDADTFYAAVLDNAQGLFPSLFTDADAFFAPTVTPGAITLTPSLFTDADTFFVPVVSDGDDSDDTLVSLI